MSFASCRRVGAGINNLTKCGTTNRFGGFADALQELHEYHLPFHVYSPAVKADILAEGLKVCEEYEVFFGRYSRYQFSKKKQEEYLRYPPMVAKGVLEDLFAGKEEKEGV